MQGESDIGPNEYKAMMESQPEPANETKMSDNEAFMAYMSKAEAGDDE